MNELNELEPDEIITCPLECSETEFFSDAESLHVHLLTSCSEQRFTCTRCQETFKGHQMKVKHLQTEVQRLTENESS